MRATPTQTALAPPDAAPGAPAVLEVAGLRKAWRRGGHVVLDGIDLRLEPGTLAWVGGENGAGKTTLLRCITGVLAPEAGTIRVSGLDAERDRRAVRRRTASLPAGNAGLYARLTVAQHLDLWARLAFVPREARRARIAGIIEDFDLQGLLHARSDRVSMGQRQRLRLAMTFLSEPALVLLDEPRTSLDATGATALEAAVRRTAAAGGSVLWCSPTGEDLAVAPDAAHVLEAGRLRPA